MSQAALPIQQLVQAAPAEPPAEPRHAMRLAGLDAARLLATFAIVWTHVAEVQGHGAGWAALGRFGTAYYTLLALLLAARAEQAGTTTFPSWIRRRASRLLKPFVVWSAVYGGFYLGGALYSGVDLQQLTLFWGPLSGTALHLWFLPFAFFIAATTRAVMGVRGPSWQGWTLCVIGLGAYWALYAEFLPTFDRGQLLGWRLHRLDRWLEELPLLLLAWGGFFVARARGARRSVAGVRWAIAAFLMVEITYGLFVDDLRLLSWTESRYLAHAAGLLLIVVALGPNGETPESIWGTESRRFSKEQPWLRRWQVLSRHTYFAFLVHQLLIDLTKRQLARWPGYGSLGFTLLTASVLLGVGLWLGMKTKKIRALAWLSP